MTAPSQRPHPNARTSMGEQVYEQLVDMLISGSIEPGRRISIDGLARQLGVSQTPIRQALALLAAEDLVTSSYLSGYSATAKLTAAELDELFELRQILEPPAVRLAVARASDEQIAEIVDLGERMVLRDQASAPLDYSAFAQLDSRFHEAILNAANNTMLSRSYVALHAHVHMFRLLRHRSVTADAIAEHELITQGLIARDPDLAHRAMVAHLNRSHQRLRAAFHNT